MKVITNRVDYYYDLDKFSEKQTKLQITVLVDRYNHWELWNEIYRLNISYLTIQNWTKYAKDIPTIHCKNMFNPHLRFGKTTKLYLSNCHIKKISGQNLETIYVNNSNVWEFDIPETCSIIFENSDLKTDVKCKSISLNNCTGNTKLIADTISVCRITNTNDDFYPTPKYNSFLSKSNFSVKCNQFNINVTESFAGRSFMRWFSKVECSKLNIITDRNVFLQYKNLFGVKEINITREKSSNKQTAIRIHNKNIPKVQVTMN